MLWTAYGGTGGTGLLGTGGTGTGGPGGVAGVTAGPVPGAGGVGTRKPGKCTATRTFFPIPPPPKKHNLSYVLMPCLSIAAMCFAISLVCGICSKLTLEFGGGGA